MAKKKKKSQKKDEMFCPYCGAKAKLVTAKDVYGDKAKKPEELIYVCSNYGKGCDAYVTTYPGTNKPYGFMADSSLRKMRMEAHRAIDEVVDSGKMKKGDVYKFLGFRLGVRDFHIGKSGIYNCKKTVELLRTISNS